MVADPTSGHILDLSHEVARLRVERTREPGDDGQRRVALTTFDLGEVREADARVRREDRPRQLPANPERADMRAEGSAEARVPVVGHDRIVRMPADRRLPTTHRDV